MAYKELTVHTVNFHYNSRMLSFSEYVSSHNSIVSESNTALKINNLIECIWHLSKDQNSIVFTAGNGGSASTAEHFSADLGQMEKRTGNAVRSLSLNSQIALNSAFTNDLNHESAMVKQLSSFKNFNYILITFSASGNSANIIKAIEYAKSNQIRTVAITAFDGGPVKKIADYSIHVPTAIGDYGVAEDSHLIISHFISSQLKN